MRMLVVEHGTDSLAEWISVELNDAVPGVQVRSKLIAFNVRRLCRTVGTTSDASMSQPAHSANSRSGRHAKRR